ncbi:MAG: 50S ribosomal protein L29 [Acidobacteriaceae bacterium]
MEIDKIRNMSDDELKNEEAKAAEQLFRVRFAKSLGKQEGIGKIKTLKLDIARIKTIARERQHANARSLATAKAGKE